MPDLVAALEEVERQRFSVVCLPDVFLDHFAQLPSFDGSVRQLEEVHARGGGNLPVPQRYEVGGNAANTAHALARLGVEATLVTRTSALGRHLLEEHLAPAGVDLSLVRDDGELATTMALEFGQERANVMLNEPGSVAHFGPSDLRERDRAAVREADAVLVANWTNTREHGTELAEAVCELAHGAGTLTYVDASDPSSRSEEVEAFVERVGTSPHLDVWAMNENELAVFADHAGPLEEAGETLASRTGAVVDVHTSDAGHSWNGGGHATAPTFDVNVARSTGAGDCWNAGNLVGHLLDLAPEDRLLLAHAVAAVRVSSPTGLPPTVRELKQFLKEHLGTAEAVLGEVEER